MEVEAELGDEVPGDVGVTAVVDVSWRARRCGVDLDGVLATTCEGVARAGVIRAVGRPRLVSHCWSSPSPDR